MKRNLTMTVETPEKGVFAHIIKDGEETIEVIKSSFLYGSVLLPYRKDSSKPLRAIPCPPPYPDARMKKELERNGYTVETVFLIDFSLEAGTLMDTDKSILYVKPENGKSYGLKELYRLLDCNLIEIIRIPDTDRILVIDEEGKFKENPQINHRASMLAHLHKAIHPKDCIVGKALFCRSALVE